MKTQIALLLSSISLITACTSNSGSGGNYSSPLPPAMPVADQTPIANTYAADSSGRGIPVVIDFGTVTSTVNKTFTIKNTTTGSLTFSKNEDGSIITFNSTQDPKGLTLVSTTCPDVIMSSQSCDVTIKLDPSQIRSTNYQNFLYGIFDEARPDSYKFGADVQVQVYATLPGKDETIEQSTAASVSGQAYNISDAKVQIVGVANPTDGTLKHLVVKLPADFVVISSSCSSILDAKATCGQYVKYVGPLTTTPDGLVELTAVDTLGNTSDFSFSILGNSNSSNN